MGMRSVPIADRDCYTYDLGTKEYERLPDVPIGKFHPALITINNRFIFQIGGFDDHDYDIYQLDMHKPNQWVTLNLDRSQPIVDDLIYEQTREYLLKVQSQDELRLQKQKGVWTDRDSEDDSDKEQEPRDRSTSMNVAQMDFSSESSKQNDDEEVKEHAESKIKQLSGIMCKSGISVDRLGEDEESDISFTEMSENEKASAMNY